jgi:uncharacterized protein YprB with RNaseH-like and TPR domain
MASGDLRKRLESLNREPLAEETSGANRAARAESAPRPADTPEVESLRRKLERRRDRRGGGAGAASGASLPDSAPASPARPRRSEAPSQIVYRRGLPVAGAGSEKPGAPPLRGEPVRLETAAPGVELAAPSGAPFYLIRRAVAELDEAVRAVDAAYHGALSDAASAARQWIAARCELDAVRPDDLVFIDLETTGLGSTPLFLIGAMAWEDGGLVVRQYFARSYAEERAVLERFLGDVADKPLLVSFNGKSFDLPYVRVRSAATGVPFRIDPAHLDLLHVSRRIWKGRLPNCKLQTLERAVCGRQRFADIPGSEIPQAYHDFVRTGDARQMATCLHHNLLDLVTLADLMTRLPGPA